MGFNIIHLYIEPHSGFAFMFSFFHGFTPAVIQIKVRSTELTPKPSDLLSSEIQKNLISNSHSTISYSATCFLNFTNL